MEQLLRDIVQELRAGTTIDNKLLSSLVRRANTGKSDVSTHVSKKKVLPFYLAQKEKNTPFWQSLQMDTELEEALFRALRAKPRRTSSGVATVTLITKPQGCASNCIYCPNDMRMPKSYLSDEPACRRAERNFFDPYLQMASRIFTLEQMGHITDKVEVIVLGGTWIDYPDEYQNWFMCELFACLNDDEETRRFKCERRKAQYESCGMQATDEYLESHAAHAQSLVDNDEMTYNQAWTLAYGPETPWNAVRGFQAATMEELTTEHDRNVNSAHRVVGLVVETRPDTISVESLTRIRQLGCTKVQIGVQSLNPETLRLNGRTGDIEDVRKAFELLRLFGFKIHAHIMANLLGSNLEQDFAEYQTFMTDPAYQPDEIKLYPCALIGSTQLMKHFETGEWIPYTQEELTELLVRDIAVTPTFTRVSRMIRDFSADDIVAGVKKTNLRQDVDDELSKQSISTAEIRSREIDSGDIDPETLILDEVVYETTATQEHFLQWITPEGGIAGFLRLSLPHQDAIEGLGDDSPVNADEAMIREVHVYGKVASLGGRDGGAQHLGLGKRLIERACQIATEAGYAKINVISAIGTRGYYEKQGFEQTGLYHRKDLL